MVAALTATLMTAAEISNLFSVLGVVVCFVCMVVFILRVRGEDLFGTSVIHMSQPPVAQMSFQKVAVPFSLELHNPSHSTYTDIQIKVRSEVSYILRSFWGVSSDHLHSLLGRPWSNFWIQFFEETQINAEVIDEAVKEDVCENSVNMRKLGLCEGSVELTLGSPPRKTYPLVICVVRQDTSSDDADPSEVGALISIIHIKDAECVVPTCILHQYLKQYSGQLTRLQALYTQSKNESQETKETNAHKVEKVEKEEEEEKGEDGEEEEEVSYEEACVVCQIKRTTRALLPCRHVCVCNTCFARLDNCPMCRANIRAYFIVAPENSASAPSEDEIIPEPRSLWQRLNATVTDLLGVEE